MNAEEYRKEKGEWKIATINSFAGWPTEYKIIEFRGRIFLLIPETDESYPAVAIRLNSRDDWKSIASLIENLLSSISWYKKGGIWITDWSGGPYPRPILKDPKTYYLVDNDYPPRHLREPSGWLPDPQEADTRLALALFREALCLKNIAYKFLSLYKIINLKFPKSKDQKNWINNNLKIVKGEAKERIDELRSIENNIGNYLYKSCRCAVAHAGLKPTFNPEDYDNKKRLETDLPVIRELAIIMIEKEFGVKTTYLSRLRR